MTKRKGEIALKPRPPTFVSRETGAAECEVSVDTWDAMEKAGLLPPRAPGFPQSTPRWRWADVDARLSGKFNPEIDAAVEAAISFGLNRKLRES